MNPDPAPDDRVPADGDVGDRNVQRLLAGAYDPEMPEAAFIESTTAAMRAVAAERSKARPGLSHGWGRSIGRVANWAVAASLVVAVGAGLVLVLSGVLVPRGKEPVDPPSSGLAVDGVESNSQPGPWSPVVARDEIAGSAAAGSRMVARSRPEPAPGETLAVGQSLETGADRRRVELPDGSVVYLNRETLVTLDATRQLTLGRGEIYLEVAPGGGAEAPDAHFVVHTPDRRVTALGTKFDVRLGTGGTGVVVTQGKVKVSGVDEPILAGEKLTAGGGRPEASTVSPARRASHVIDWTRDLMAAVDSPLVPASDYSGGALTVVDGDGRESKLSLRKYHVDVHVEDGFARTTIDQTYFNHRTERLEGTFRFPLPPDASLSRLAMYVGEKLMEGGMAERGHARQVFETIVRSMKDPALLEWVDGSTFKMRVFPLEGRQEKRIVLSYTQRLPLLYDRMEYRFQGGHSMDRIGRWSCRVRVKDGANRRWSSDSHQLEASREQGDLVLEAAAENVKPDRNIVLRLFESAEPDSAAPPCPALFSSARHEGSKYLMLRLRPELAATERAERRDWIFLFESSADRNPLLARVQVDVVKTLLENANHDDTFSILTAATRVHSMAEKPKPATPKNVRKAVKFLEGAHLIGALNLERALAAAGPLVDAAENPYLVHVGSGLPSLGEQQVDVLLRRVPKAAPYVGVGVGKRWSRALMKTAAGCTGGYFTQINPDEQVAWRAFELLSTLNTPRLLNVAVVDQAERYRFLCHSDFVAQGEELAAIARMDEDDKLPKSVEVTGTLDGRPFSETVPVRDVASKADYLPRTWAKLEIDRLVAEGAEQNRSEIIRLSKAMYVMSPFTSLLVLENEAMYEQYNVDRGRKDHWALYPCPERIDIVHEPLPKPTSPVVARSENAAGPTEEDVLKTMFLRTPATRFLRADGGDALGYRTTSIWSLLAGDAAQFGAVRPAGDAFSWHFPDGGSGIRLWDITTESWDTPSINSRPANGTWGLAFSPDGRIFASSSLDQTSNVWDVPAWNPYFHRADPRVSVTGFRAAVAHQRARIEQMITADVQNTINRARGRMSDDPAASIQDLKLQLENVRWAPELELDVRDQLVDQLQAAVRQAEQRETESGERRQQQHEALAAAKDRALSNEDLLRRAEKMEQLMERFNSLMEEGRYRNAEETVAREAQELDPNAVIPGSATHTARMLGYYRDAMVLRVARQKRAIDTLYQLERGHVPFPDEPPIVYPEAEVWQQLTNRRRERYSWMDLATQGSAEQRIAAELKAPTDLQFIETPLTDVVETLKDYHDIEIQIDQRALDDVEVPLDTGITKDLKGISLRSALRLILRELDLTYVIEDDVLLITTPEEAETWLGTRVYPVADLVFPIRSESMHGMGGMGGMMGGGMGGMTGMGWFPMGGSMPVDGETDDLLLTHEVVRLTNQLQQEARDHDALTSRTSKLAADLAKANEVLRTHGLMPAADLARVNEVLRRHGLKPEPALYSGIAPPVDGLVLQVNSEGHFVEVSMGADDGLMKGQMLDVFRESGGWIGRVKVTHTAPDTAIAKVLGGFLQRPIRRDDRVTTSIRDMVIQPKRISHDLLRYASGLNTTWADVRAVVDAEAGSKVEPETGEIDNRARKLIQKARSAGWQRATLLDEDGGPVQSIDFDGTGRLRYERTTGSGLRETVISGGAHLWHLYDELGLGARRELSRFHRAKLLRMIPWALPPVEDLARDADLEMAGKLCVAVVPRGAAEVKDEDGKPVSYVAVHLVFDSEGRLTERRLVRMPDEKTLLSQTLEPDGSVRWHDRHGELLLELGYRLEPCGAPDLMPDERQLVVAPMPLRSRIHLRQTLKADGKIDDENLSEDVALALISAELGSPRATEIINRRFLEKGDRRPGFYVLWMAGGVELPKRGKDDEADEVDDEAFAFDPLQHHPDEPLAKYLTGRLESRRADGWQEIGPIGGQADGFLQQLAEFHDLWGRWTASGELAYTPEIGEKHEAFFRRSLDFVGRSTSERRAWAVFTLLLDELRALDAGDSSTKAQRNEQKRRLGNMLLETIARFEDVPGLRYVARYERARTLWEVGRREEGRELVVKLYEEAIEAGFLPPIDRRFRETFFGHGGRSEWREFVRRMADRLIAEDVRQAAIRLARSVHQAGDPVLADEVFSGAMVGVKADQRWATTLAAVEYLWHTDQRARADAELQRLLIDERHAPVAALWRLAAVLADERGMTGRSLACRQRALEIEYDELPDMVELKPIRRQYGALLDRYQELAATVKSLGAEPSQEWIGQVVRTADRWRSLDSDPAPACRAAAGVLADLDASELAWDYLTTAVAGDPETPVAWQPLAKTLRGEGRYELADRAYAWASATEPANAEVLWDRAQALLEAGRGDEAQPLFQQLADGDWDEAYRDVKSQARSYLEQGPATEDQPQRKRPLGVR